MNIRSARACVRMPDRGLAMPVAGHGIGGAPSARPPSASATSATAVSSSATSASSTATSETSSAAAAAMLGAALLENGMETVPDFYFPGAAANPSPTAPPPKPCRKRPHTPAAALGRPSSRQGAAAAAAGAVGPQIAIPETRIMMQTRPRSRYSSVREFVRPSAGPLGPPFLVSKSVCESVSEPRHHFPLSHPPERPRRKRCQRKVALASLRGLTLARWASEGGREGA